MEINEEELSCSINTQYLGEEAEVWHRATLTHLVTKHLSTSSCLQTNSMKRGDVILNEEREGGEEQGRWRETGNSHQLLLFYHQITQLNFDLHTENDQASCSQNDKGLEQQKQKQKQLIQRERQ